MNSNYKVLSNVNTLLVKFIEVFIVNASLQKLSIHQLLLRSLDSRTRKFKRQIFINIISVTMIKKNIDIKLTYYKYIAFKRKKKCIGYKENKQCYKLLIIRRMLDFQLSIIIW